MPKSKQPERKEIVVCDDDQGILNVVKIILEKKGFSVATCLDGDSIFDIIDETQPQLVLLDLWMPGMGGEAICKQLKSDPETEALPVVIMSASQDAPKVAEAAGAEDYLAKPFGISQLEATASKYVSK